MLDATLDTPKSVTLSPRHENRFLNGKSPARLEDKQHSRNDVSNQRNASIKPIEQYQDALSQGNSQRRGSASNHKSEESMVFLSGASNNTNGQEEEVADYTEEGRMLQDPTGRLCESHLFRRCRFSWWTVQPC